jgi:hypothetical protein
MVADEDDLLPINIEIFSDKLQFILSQRSTNLLNC